MYDTELEVPEVHRGENPISILEESLDGFSTPSSQIHLTQGLAVRSRNWDSTSWRIRGLGTDVDAWSNWYGRYNWGDPDSDSLQGHLTQIYAATGERGDNTDKKSEIPCLTLSEWPSKESLRT